MLYELTATALFIYTIIHFQPCGVDSTKKGTPG